MLDRLLNDTHRLTSALTGDDSPPIDLETLQRTRNAILELQRAELQMLAQVHSWPPPSLVW